MGKVYNGQSSLRIELDTGVDISTATTKKIKYIKPNGATGYYTATLSSDNQTVYYDFAAGDISIGGLWIFWAYVTFLDGREAPGEKVNVIFYNEGE